MIFLLYRDDVKRLLFTLDLLLLFSLLYIFDLQKIRRILFGGHNSVRDESRQTLFIFFILEFCFYFYLLSCFIFYYLFIFLLMPAKFADLLFSVYLMIFYGSLYAV